MKGAQLDKYKGVLSEVDKDDEIVDVLKKSQIK